VSVFDGADIGADATTCSCALEIIVFAYILGTIIFSI